MPTSLDRVGEREVLDNIEPEPPQVTGIESVDSMQHKSFPICGRGVTW